MAWGGGKKGSPRFSPIAGLAWLVKVQIIKPVHMMYGCGDVGVVGVVVVVDGSLERKDLKKRNKTGSGACLPVSQNEMGWDE